MGAIMSGEATQAQIGGFLVALRLKGETADEIAGCAEAMREHVLAVKPKRDDLVDTAGTGGDNAHTFNISTAAALVAAAAGAGVAKHGNRAVSSSSGSADVLEALGFSLDLPPARIERSIDELGFGFLFAPRITRRCVTRRRCGASSRRARSSTFSARSRIPRARGRRSSASSPPELVPTIADVLAQLGARRAFVVHGAGGIDELSPAGANLVCEVVDGEVVEREIDPLDLGVPRCDPAELRGGTPAENAATIRAIFSGADGARADAADQRRRRDRRRRARRRPARGLDAARTAVASGAAAERLDALTAFSRRTRVLLRRDEMGRFSDALRAPGSVRSPR